MKTFKDIREQIIKEYISKQLLSESIYPSLSMVCAIFMDEYKDVDYNSSLLKNRHLINDEDHASFTWMNDIAEKVQLDILTIYNFIDYIYNYLILSNTIAKNKMDALSHIIRLLQADLKEIELAKDIPGENIVLNETFINNTNIDLDNTDAYIDLDNGIASSKKIFKITQSTTYNIASIEQFAVTQGYVQFGSPISNTVANFTSPQNWIAEYKMPIGFKDNVEFKVNIILDEPIELSSISFPVLNTEDIYVKAICLVDNVYKTVSDYVSYNKFVNINFVPITTNTIILFFKISNILAIDDVDKTSKYYKLTANNLQLSNYIYDTKSILTTKEITTSAFSNVALTTNSLIEDNTSIDYYLSWYSNSAWTSYVPIQTYDIENNNRHIVSVLSDVGLSFVNGKTLDFDAVHSYLNFYNTATNYTETSLTYLSLINPVILRNINGFFINDELAECWLNIQVDATTIDFTSYVGYLDGEYTATPISLDKGYYNFKFNINNGLTRYSAYFKSIANLKFGSNIAKYIDSDIFLNIVEDYDYSKFTFVNIGGTPTAIFKKLSSNVTYDSINGEIFTVIKNDIAPEDTALLPTKLKLKIQFNSDNINTAKLYDLQLKVS